MINVRFPQDRSHSRNAQHLSKRALRGHPRQRSIGQYVGGTGGVNGPLLPFTIL
ncbi:MAG: hypothetical protein WBC90_18680 [Albidovulum sp.]